MLAKKYQDLLVKFYTHESSSDLKLDIDEILSFSNDFMSSEYKMLFWNLLNDFFTKHNEQLKNEITFNETNENKNYKNEALTENLIDKNIIDNTKNIEKDNSSNIQKNDETITIGKKKVKVKRIVKGATNFDKQTYDFSPRIR